MANLQLEEVVPILFIESACLSPGHGYRPVGPGPSYPLH